MQDMVWRLLNVPKLFYSLRASESSLTCGLARKQGLYDFINFQLSLIAEQILEVVPKPSIGLKDKAGQGVQPQEYI